MKKLTLSMANALANNHRLAMLDYLTVNRHTYFTVNAIANHCDISHSQASQHLSRLANEGLVIQRQSGTMTLNTINPNINWPLEVFK